MKRIIILIIGIFVMVSCVYVPVTENTSVDYSVVRSAQKAIPDTLYVVKEELKHYYFVKENNELQLVEVYNVDENRIMINYAFALWIIFVVFVITFLIFKN